MSTNVRKLMLSRLDLAVPKDCDSVNPDHMDGFDNDNGIGLTQADTWDYISFLADTLSVTSV